MPKKSEPLPRKKKAMRSIPFCKGMVFFLFKDASGKVYPRMRLNVYIAIEDKYLNKQFTFTRANYDEVYEEWCKLSMKVHDYRKRPETWKKPPFNTLLKQWEISENVLYRYQMIEG